MRQFFILHSSPKGVDREALEDQLKKSLECRLSSPNYSKDEVLTVSNIDHRFKNPADSGNEELRSLARLSNLSLPSSSQITSHRKFFGWAIVLIKKALWGVFSLLLNKLVDGLRAYALFSTKKIVEHSSRLDEIERKLKSLEEPKA